MLRKSKYSIKLYRNALCAKKRSAKYFDVHPLEFILTSDDVKKIKDFCEGENFLSEIHHCRVKDFVNTLYPKYYPKFKMYFDECSHAWHPVDEGEEKRKIRIDKENHANELLSIINGMRDVCIKLDSENVFNVE